MKEGGREGREREGERERGREGGREGKSEIVRERGRRWWETKEYLQQYLIVTEKEYMKTT